MLKKIKKEKIDKQLSLESYNESIVNESWNTYAVQYQVFDRDGRISTKTKEFKTEKALQNWIAKQEDNPNFYGILATSYPDEIKLKEDNEDNEYYRERNKWESMNESEELKVGDIVNWNNVVWVKINSIDGNKANVSPIYKRDIDSGKFEKEEIVLLNSLRKSNESIKEGFNKGDKVQLKRKNNKIGIVKSIFNGDKDKNGKDIKYLDVEFEDGTKEGRPASDFRKVKESIKEDWSAEDIDNYNRERITKVKQALEEQFKRLWFTDIKWNEAKQIYFFKYLDEPYYIVINTPGINGTGYDLYKANDYGVAKGRLLTYRDVWLMPEDVTPFVRAVLSDIHKFILVNESIKESLQDEYKQAFNLLIEGENIVGTLDTDFGKQFVKDVESLYEIKSYKLKLRKAKDLLMDIYGYLIDERFDDYNSKIIKFINNSKNESISHLKNLQRLLETTINKCL